MIHTVVWNKENDAVQTLVPSPILLCRKGLYVRSQNLRMILTQNRFLSFALGIRKSDVRIHQILAIDNQLSAFGQIYDRVCSFSTILRVSCVLKYKIDLSLQPSTF